MKFEKINPKNYGELLFKMDTEAFCRDFDYPSPSIKMTLDYLKGCEVYLAYLDKDPIGLFAYMKKNNNVEVKQIVVMPRYQNKGYGKIIVRKLLDLVKGSKIWLVTHPKNKAAIILYLKMGFLITGWKDNYYDDGQPRLLLQLEQD